MDRFFTLMKREWMQHRIGWLVVMAVPTLLMLVLSLFDGRGLQLKIDGDAAVISELYQLPVALQTVGWSFATGLLTFVLACLAVLAQLPGLARRDVQDRSIEFWRSLPTSHVQSVGATVLMHLLVLPGLALMAGVLGAQLVALVAISSHLGLGAWLTQPWWMLLPAMLVMTARMLLGLLLAVAWLSPLLLLTMAASAWLKRWAVPVVVATLVVGVQWLDHQLPVAVVKPALDRIGSEAMNALLATNSLKALHFDGPEGLAAALPDLPALLLRDAAQVLGNTASPAFVAALLVGAAGFGLLVLRRMRAE